jgi:hypothetical protein
MMWYVCMGGGSDVGHPPSQIQKLRNPEVPIGANVVGPPPGQRRQMSLCSLTLTRFVVGSLSDACGLNHRSPLCKPYALCIGSTFVHAPFFNQERPLGWISYLWTFQLLLFFLFAINECGHAWLMILHLRLGVLPLLMLL